MIRVRGWVDIPKSDIVSGVETTIRAFGICVFPAETALVTDAVPNPATINGQDWDGWTFLRSSSQVALDITGTVVDVKAMRKIQGGDAICLVYGIATDAVGGAAGQTVIGSLRALVMLS